MVGLILSYDHSQGLWLNRKWGRAVSVIRRKKLEKQAEQITLNILTLDKCREEQGKERELKLYTMKTS